MTMSLEQMLRVRAVLREADEKLALAFEMANAVRIAEQDVVAEIERRLSVRRVEAKTVDFAAAA
ncbi:MAG: hypothetical protein R3D33_15710 [Hyphomicrobiaceae bacterium]